MVILETPRLLIRDYMESDLHNLHRLLSNRKNMYYLSELTTNSIEETSRNIRSAIENKDGHYFALCNNKTGIYIGRVGYKITEKTPVGKIVYMGYFILPEYHGLGYTTEAVKEIVDFAFKKDDCIRISADCYADNIASIRVMEKAGFLKEGVHVKAAWHDGKLKNKLSYAINIDNYLEG